MSFPDLPGEVTLMMADERVRLHHHLWHLVSNSHAWDGLPDDTRKELTDAGWKAPRFGEEPGSGVDFLGMHRHMIHMVNMALHHAGDPNWRCVVGWNPIPWEDNDPDWPVPPWPNTRPPWATEEEWGGDTEIALDLRSPYKVQENREIAERFDRPSRNR